MLCNSFRYAIAASVALKGSMRSSMNVSRLSPNLYPVDGMNCQRPRALAFERAFALKPLSIRGSHDSSTGSPAFLSASTICGRYIPERLYDLIKNFFSFPFVKRVISAWMCLFITMGMALWLPLTTIFRDA